MTAHFGSLALLLPLLVALAVTAVACAVILSFAIAWYDRANAGPPTGVRRNYPLAIRLVLTECASLLLTLLLRPLGWLPVRIPAGPTRRPPVILLHGLFQNRACMLPLKWRLRTAGYDRVIAIGTPCWHPFDRQLATLAATVERALAGSGHPRALLVGHSMGGVLACSYLRQRDVARRVAACVTIAAPHGGSKLAPFAVTRLGRALQPGSPLLTRLQAAPLPAGVRCTAIGSRHDNIVIPPENARLEGAANIELIGIGHTTLLFSAQVAREIVAALGEGRMTDDR
jgi:pimeloyl-ACP methyl ester carboxylesterase